MALPSQFRSSIGEHCFLTYGEDGCVRLRGADAFRVAAERVKERAAAGEISRSHERAFFASTVQAALDKQGRIVVDQKLRDHAGLAPQAPVTLIGVYDVIELWEPQRYEREETAGQHEIETGVAAGGGGAAT